MVLKKRCKTCQNWKPEDSEQRKRRQIFLGECSKAEDVSQYGFDYVTDPFGLYSSDGESWHSCIMTGENFGCIHWRKIT
jgi:hypothetical protein